ncbi:MAG: ABC transporter permease [Gemmatimonadetes bacterium]|nr:ABC transporter permease [Gemmatimonadota bacterium]
MAVGSVATATAASLLLLFLLLPVGELVVQGGAGGLERLAGDAELQQALALTAWTASLATLIGVALGTPLAWILSRRKFPGRTIVTAALDLPLVIPHPVAGIALLLVLGRESAIGGMLAQGGYGIVSSPLGIILAMLFVSAPLYVSGAREAMARVDRRYESVAQTLGDTPWQAFRRVTLPLASRGLLASAVVMWARAVSEFGAIVILVHHPRTVSVLSYDRFTTYGLTEVIPVAAALVILALLPLVALRALRRGEGDRT